MRQSLKSSVSKQLDIVKYIRKKSSGNSYVFPLHVYIMKDHIFLYNTLQMF
jgi:hypothetical protein